jgi:hypothetical protein
MGSEYKDSDRKQFWWDQCRQAIGAVVDVEVDRRQYCRSSYLFVWSIIRTKWQRFLCFRHKTITIITDKSPRSLLPFLSELIASLT